MSPNTITQVCSGCFRHFTMPMYDKMLVEQTATNEYKLTCVCGTENRYPLMAVLPFPLKAEVPV